LALQLFTSHRARDRNDNVVATADSN